MQHLAEQFLAFVRALVKFWEGLQVELQGQYSPTRLDELRTFTHETSVLRSTAILLLTPIICTVTTVALDVLPLRPPAEGVYRQSITYWLRLGFTYTAIVPCAILQLQHASPRLPFRGVPVIATTALIATAAQASFLCFHLLVGFPTPFAFQLAGLPLYPLLGIAFWAMWKNAIRGDTELQHDLRQFSLYSSCQSTMLMLYPVMIFVFDKLNGIQQTLFSFAFPALKLMFKNWASRGLYRHEDTAPVCTVVCIDVFHTLLLSCAMQSAVSRATLVSVMAIDVFQSIVALVEVRAVVERLRRLGRDLPGPDRAPSLRSETHRQINSLSLACAFLESRPYIRDDPAIGLPRHRRLDQQRVVLSLAALVSLKRVARVACAAPSLNVNSVEPAFIKEPCDVMNRRAAEVEYVRFTLKLFHMVEFYVLIEFIEVVVAAIYAIYLTAMYYLPNRAYYPSVRTLTHDQFVETIGHLLQYAVWELLSLAVLCVVLDRLLGISTLRLLAFTLRSHAALAQSQLTLWVFLSTQLSLEHFGCDYTFRFAWLRHPVKQTTP